MIETGYIIRLKNDTSETYYFRGCARGRSDPWCKRIGSAQIYAGRNAALKALSESNKISTYKKDIATVVEVRLEVAE